MNIDSKNKKILIFSDVHHEHQKAQKIINHESADVNVCLGDIWDSFYLNDNSDVIGACGFLNEFLSKENSISCFGNHDVSYLYQSYYTSCSGWEPRKQKVIDEHFNRSLLPKIKWFCWVDDYLCTHAGLHPYFLPPMIGLNKEEITEFLQKESQLAQKALEEKKQHWFFGAGRARGGNQKRGGLNWLDWSYEFEPIKEIHQIVGHTNGSKVRSYSSVYKNDICIDCHLAEYLTITNGEMEIKKFVDL